MLLQIQPKRQGQLERWRRHPLIAQRPTVQLVLPTAWERQERQQQQLRSQLVLLLKQQKH